MIRSKVLQRRKILADRRANNERVKAKLKLGKPAPIIISLAVVLPFPEKVDVTAKKDLLYPADWGYDYLESTDVPGSLTQKEFRYDF